MSIIVYPALAGIARSRPADKTALGTLPIRSCHSVRAASGLGMYYYSPVDWEFQWDGGAQLDVWLNGEELGSLDPGDGVRHPPFDAAWDAAAPEYLRGQLYALAIRSEVQPNMLQLWTGWHLRSEAGWSALVRPPANLPSPFGYYLYEGLVNSGPLFASVVLTKTDTRVSIRAHYPLLQLQAVPLESYKQTVITEVPAPTQGDVNWYHYQHNVVLPDRTRKETERNVTGDKAMLHALIREFEA